MKEEIFSWTPPSGSHSIPVHYRKTGTGPCIVLLHGFTESLRIWDDLSNALSAAYTVIRPDLPGHGQTPVYGAVHAMEDMADMIAQITQDQKPHLVIGHSMGGYVALAYADKYPERLLGLGLFHSTAAPDSTEKKADRLRASALALQDKKGFVTTLIPRLFAQANRTTLASAIEQLRMLALQTPAEGISAALLGMRQRPDRSHILQTISVPVLILYGLDDEVIPPARSAEEAKLPKDCMAHLLAKSGHMGFLEEPEETKNTIKKFIEHCIRKK